MESCLASSLRDVYNHFQASYEYSAASLQFLVHQGWEADFFVVTGVSIVAIDGPVASGKTAVGRLLARRLGHSFFDTGAMYRAVTWLALEAEVDLDDADGLTRLASERVIEVVFDDEGNAAILLDQRDATAYLRLQEVEEGVSQVSRVPGVREAMVAQQRRIAQKGRLIIVGRDIGTVVMPDAPVKVFLTASVEERARRRYQEFQALGKLVEYGLVLEELERRDRLDSERVVAPLRPALDASIVDTDGLSVEEVVVRIVGLVEERS